MSRKQKTRSHNEWFMPLTQSRVCSTCNAGSNLWVYIIPQPLEKNEYGFYSYDEDKRFVNTVLIQREDKTFNVRNLNNENRVQLLREWFPVADKSMSFTAVQRMLRFYNKRKPDNHFPHLVRAIWHNPHYVWGEYFNARWSTVKHFCQACHVESVIRPLINHSSSCGCEIELVGRSGYSVPEWLDRSFRLHKAYGIS